MPLTAKSADAPAAPGATMAHCLATSDASCKFEVVKFARRPLGHKDVLIDVKYCGCCHTDLHFARGDMNLVMPVAYPCVPGHEIAGVVSAVGPGVTKVAVGDHVGVGCSVDSCGTCAACKAGDESYCAKNVATYNGRDRGNGRAAPGPGAPRHTLGGYSTATVVTERFVFRVPKTYPLECVGPVMCAGVTLYDPLRRYGAGPGVTVGVVGVGGLGVIGIKLARALGADVVAVTRGAAKDGIARRAGAQRVVHSTDAASMAAEAGCVDLLLNCVPVEHDYWAYAPLLRRGSGKHVLLGMHGGFVAAVALGASDAAGASCRRSRGSIRYSMNGGVPATQEVIDLCAAHDIRPEIAVVPVERLGYVLEQLDASNESGVRYVLDIAGSLRADAEGAASRCAAAPPPRLGKAAPIRAGAIAKSVWAQLWRA